ncbi:sce7726 family protein [Acetobacterium malicum]|uniref:sce7726 family protein n=1 Tax=Acetobacterium malicum TaxID=52692 RepID=UPI0003FB116F|nr:sce7726 family protein [Acetobacterium dehalogenans]
MGTNNVVLNRLFTQNVFRKLINDNENMTFGTIVQRYASDFGEKKNGELISEIYNFMSKSYRNEYFFQNTLLNKLLLGRHSVNTTIALTQIPIGKSKADFILINGKAVVYEIKSELDSFDRLNTQIKDYYKAFNHVCVVTSENNFNRLLNILDGTPVGICVLTKRDTISKTLKKDMIEDNSKLEHQAIFKVLHKGEYEAIIKQLFGKLPKASQVFYYDECYSMFSQIPIFEAYAMSLKQLKNRNHILRNKIEKVPYELKSLMYFSNPSSQDYENLEIFLQNKFRG